MHQTEATSASRREQGSEGGQTAVPTAPWSPRKVTGAAALQILLQNKHHLPMFLQPQSVGFNILDRKAEASELGCIAMLRAHLHWSWTTAIGPRPMTSSDAILMGLL